jgi:hypothetical protein
MRKIVLTFGLISGAILAAMMLISFSFQDAIGFDNGAVVGYTSMVLAFLLVYFGVRTYRDEHGGGTVTFGRAFKVGILITGVATACYVATWQVVYYRMMPDFMDRYSAHAIENAKKSGASEAKVAQVTKDMAEFKELYKNPLINIALTFLEPLPVGLLFTLVTAGILSRKRREPLAAAS